MAERATSNVDLLSMAEKQGETFATVREIKHAVNNMAQKVDAMAYVVEQVKQLALDRDDHEKRLAVLEADKHRREGAVGLVEWISKHWPITLLVAAVTFLWAIVEGKLK
jgi:hypothetical protein